MHALCLCSQFVFSICVSRMSSPALQCSRVLGTGQSSDIRHMPARSARPEQRRPSCKPLPTLCPGPACGPWCPTSRCRTPQSCPFWSCFRIRMPPSVPCICETVRSPAVAGGARMLEVDHGWLRRASPYLQLHPPGRICCLRIRCACFAGRWAMPRRCLAMLPLLLCLQTGELRVMLIRLHGVVDISGAQRSACPISRGFSLAQC